MMPVLLAQAGDGADSSGLGFWLVTLALLSLLPFLLAVITSFAKIVVVGGLLRQALGLQQTPPNSVITGLALLLSLTIMMPVVSDCVVTYRALSAETEQDAGQLDIAANLVAAVEPNVREFSRTARQAELRERVRFTSVRTRCATRAGRGGGGRAEESGQSTGPRDDAAGIDDRATALGSRRRHHGQRAARSDRARAGVFAQRADRGLPDRPSCSSCRSS